MSSRSVWIRSAGALLVTLAIGGTAWLHYHATDFPREDPVRVVDSALVDRLRAEPGLHVALAEDYELVVNLELKDDAFNRLVYGTDVDLREEVGERSIHIQRKGDRGAIHADGHNPKAGVWAWLVHATIDVPFLPLPVLFVVGLMLVLRSKRSPNTLAAPSLARGEPASTGSAP